MSISAYPISWWNVRVKQRCHANSFYKQNPASHFSSLFLGQSPVPEEEAVVAPQIEPQLNNIDFLQGKDQAFGVGSASIQSLNEEPQEVIDIVEYDATIPGDYHLLCWV